jgi:hypothetical protein
VHFAQVFVVELTIRPILNGSSYMLEGVHVTLMSNQGKFGDNRSGSVAPKKKMSQGAMDVTSEVVNPLKWAGTSEKNLQNLVSLMTTMLRGTIQKKCFKSLSSMLSLASFKVRSVMYLSKIVDDLMMRHNIVAMALDSSMGAFEISLRLRNVSEKKLVFRLNLLKNWFDDIEMRLGSERNDTNNSGGTGYKLTQKQIESMNKRLIMVFNREIANSALDKFRKLFAQLDAFRIIAL